MLKYVIYRFVFKETKLQLKNLREANSRINPNRFWVTQNRERLMIQIGNMVDKSSSHYSLSKLINGFTLFLPSKTLQAATRPVMVFLLVIGLATSGWIAGALATENCLPGDICYGVKLAAEKTQELAVAVVGSKESKTQLQLEFATRRAKEIKQVVETKKGDPSAKVAMEHLRNSIQLANEGVKQMGQNEGVKQMGQKETDKMIDLVKNVNDKTTEIMNTLKEVQKQSEVVSKDLAKEVVATKNAVNEIKIAAVEMVAQKSAEGTLDPNKKEEVKDLVLDTIKTVISENENAKIDVTEMKALTGATASTTVNNSALNTISTSTTSASSSVISSVNTILSVGTTTVELKNMVDQVAKKVDEKTEAVKDNMQQAQTMVNNNQLLQAMQKVRESSETTKEVQQTVVEVKTTVNQTVSEVVKVEPLAPVVSVSTTPTTTSAP